MNKRAVLQLASGLKVIMGVLDPKEHEIKPSIRVTYRGQSVYAILRSVGPRSIVYQEQLDAPTSDVPPQAHA